MEIIAAFLNLMYAFESPKLDLYNLSYGHFLGLLQLRLFNGLCPDFGIVRGLVSELSSKLFCGLLCLVVWNFLWASLFHD